MIAKRFSSGSEINKFTTEDKVLDFLTPLGNNMISFAITVAAKKISFLPNHYEVIKNEKIKAGFLLNSTNDSADPYEFHVLNFGENMFPKMELEELFGLLIMMMKIKERITPSQIRQW